MAPAEIIIASVCIVIHWLNMYLPANTKLLRKITIRQFQTRNEYIPASSISSILITYVLKQDALVLNAAPVSSSVWGKNDVYYHEHLVIMAIFHFFREKKDKPAPY